MTTVHEVADKLRVLRELFDDTITTIEDQFAKIAVYPATIPMYVLPDREPEFTQDRQHPGRRYKSPVAYLHFTDGHLQFSEVPKPWPYTGKPVPKCSGCRKACGTCERHRQEARKRWDEREAKKGTPIDVLELDDGNLLLAIVKMFPAMKKRLEADAKVTPEEIEEATQAVARFIASLP